MFRRSLRAALITVAGLVMTAVPLGATAHASGSCGNGTAFVGATSGQLDWYEYEDWYETTSTGPTRVAVDGSEYYYVYLEVWDSSCSYVICSNGWNYSLSCDIDYVGEINIRYYSGYGYPSTYTLTSTPLGVPVPSVQPECNDGIDNDLDGRTDYPSDNGCSDYSDNSEFSTGTSGCTPVLGLPTCVKVVNGPIDRQVTVYGPRFTTTATHTVVGTVDIYRFPLPTGGSITAPCVVLTVNSATSNSCQTAGGTYVDRVFTLVNQSVNQPGVEVDVPLATARVCKAEYTVTVAGIGLNDFPAFSLC